MAINPYESPFSPGVPTGSSNDQLTAIRLLALAVTLMAVFAAQIATFHLLYWSRVIRFDGPFAAFFKSDEMLFFIHPVLIVLAYLATFKLLIRFQGLSAWGLAWLASGGLIVVGEVISMMMAFTRWGT